MFRRRRRRSGFSRRTPQQPFIMIAAAVFGFVALFIFFIRQADVLAPRPQEVSVELPDAFKE